MIIFIAKCSPEDRNPTKTKEEMGIKSAGEGGGRKGKNMVLQCLFLHLAVLCRLKEIMMQ